ncbi:Endonuclease/exonuclease/phosphatase [Russula vinacea]|nr:Endonuclease/exonuclease/phosphatase [Russula vinacea]
MPTIHDAHPTAPLDHIDIELVAQWEKYTGKLLALPFDRETQDVTLYHSVMERIFTAVAEITKSRKIVWSSTAITFWIVKLNLPCPNLLFTIYGFSTLVTEDILNMVRTVWQGNDVLSLIDTIANSFPENVCARAKSSIQAFINSVKVTRLDYKSSSDTPQPHFNIYASSSLIENDDIWAYLREFLANCSYASPMHGQGMTCLIPFHCTLCHRVDYPRGLCPFPSIPSWNGPSMHPSNATKCGRGGRMRGLAHGTATCGRRDNNRKANITIATLNVNGFTAPSSSLSGIEKWTTIVCTMNKHKIAILAIQETHLDDNQLDDICSLFKQITFYELQEGRALALKVKWNETREVDMALLNIFAPNNKSEHKQFWENIETKRRLYRLHHPDFMLRDFNVTEENIDRAPAHPDDLNAISALREICHSWELQDAWCHSHPTERCFTYCNNANGQQIQSCLDRIYIARGTSWHTYGWHMGPTPTPTDHWIITVKYSPKDAPLIGPGRWTWSIPSLQKDKLMSRVISHGIQLQDEINSFKRNNTPRETTNPQLLWGVFKQDITTLAKALTKEERPE